MKHSATHWYFMILLGSDKSPPPPGGTIGLPLIGRPVRLKSLRANEWDYYGDYEGRPQRTPGYGFQPYADLGIGDLLGRYAERDGSDGEVTHQCGPCTMESSTGTTSDASPWTSGTI